jgi:hypothetical protein
VYLAASAMLTVITVLLTRETRGRGFAADRVLQAVGASAPAESTAVDGR